MAKKLRLVGVVALVLGVALVGIAWVVRSRMVKGDVTCRMTAKDRVITGAYKSYGVKDCKIPMWLAKTVFTNGTSGRITDLRIRYKLGEYADWCPDHQFAAVDPTQAVVDLYHPILSSLCAKLTSRAPVELQMQYDYVDAKGQKQSGSDAKQITMMGRHEFIFSDLTEGESTGSFQDNDTYSPLLAAWVSSSDDVVARLASMGNKLAGGLGASQSDEDCIKVMAALYDVMRKIHISYQHPPAMVDPTLSYDVKTVQSLQYPRDTIEKKSGTCIDLAILYAAMLNSVNIPPYLVTMDGHCFPMGRTPSGNLIPVEATGVGDGGQKSASFVQAYKSAMNTWRKVNQTGRFDLIDVRDCWMRGVPNPELESLPPDILEKWGIVALLEAKGPPTPKPPDDQGRPDDEGERPPQINLAGRWSYELTAGNGSVTKGIFQIAVQGNNVQLIAAAAYQFRAQDGQVHQCQEQNNFVGQLQGQNLVAQCNEARLVVDGVAQRPQGLPIKLVMTVAPDGRSMRGQVSNALGGSANITAQR